MTIKQVITLAQNGELSNIATKSNISAIVGYINLGLIEMYKRFPLQTKEHIIALEANRDVYDLPSDCMWIVAAYDEVPEDSDAVVVEVPINEEDNPLSLNTIGWNQVQIPMTTNGAFISVIYVAAPPVIDYVESTDSYTLDGVAGTDLPLPPQMLEALLHYVGYRAHAAMNGNIQAENSTHYTRFENSCNRIEQRGMFTNDDLAMRHRVQDKGFI